jgi:putative membrane protein
MRVINATALSWLLLGASLAAHEGEHHGWNAPGALSAWDLAVVAFLLLFGAVYAIGATRTPARTAVRAAFACGWTVLLISVLPPLDDLAIQLFSAHMVQHELMMLVGAPLVIAGRPLATCLWGLPARWRAAAGGVLQTSAAGGTWRLLTAPATAWALHGTAVWVWHIPALYDAAVGNESVHALQHAMFVGTSAMFWWGLLYGRYGRAGYGAAVFYVFTTVVHTGLLGAMVTFARDPLYPAYLGPAAARGVNPLEDQQVAGLVMWIPAGVILTLLGVGLFAAWIGEAERRERVNRLRA